MRHQGCSIFTVSHIFTNSNTVQTRKSFQQLLFQYIELFLFVNCVILFIVDVFTGCMYLLSKY